MKQKNRPQTAEETRRKEIIRFENKGKSFQERRSMMWENEKGKNQPLALFI